MEPLTLTSAVAGGLAFMFAGWVVFIPIWIIARFTGA